MPSRSRLGWLLVKESRELMASRAFWLLLLMIGPLVGHGFITAVQLYAEASGIGGGPAALAQGLSPLDGILVPTFGAYDLAVTLLFPFVAIRLISAPFSWQKAWRCWRDGFWRGRPACWRWFCGRPTAVPCTRRKR